jgi:hypothetical protein
MPDTDADFLNYVLQHSTTPRHAFSEKDADRLMDLAGAEEMIVGDCGLRNFVGIDEDEGERLVDLARARLKK